MQTLHNNKWPGYKTEAFRLTDFQIDWPCFHNWSSHGHGSPRQRPGWKCKLDAVVLPGVFLSFPYTTYNHPTSELCLLPLRTENLFTNQSRATNKLCKKRHKYVVVICSASAGGTAHIARSYSVLLGESLSISVLYLSCTSKPVTQWWLMAFFFIRPYVWSSLSQAVVYRLH